MNWRKVFNISKIIKIKLIAYSQKIQGNEIY